MKNAYLVACLLLPLTAGSSTAPAGAPAPTFQPETASEQADEAQAELEAAFAELMTGVTMLGHFTLEGAPDQTPHEEAYRLGVVKKLGGTKWSFEAEIEYGGKSTKVPLVLDVMWAGDTPVITLTDMSIPLMGTFTSRVVIYDNQYAGLWSGGDHGGQMYGRLIPAGSEEAEGAEGAEDGQ